MKLTINKACNALYLRLDDSEIIESEEVEKGVILDFNADGNVVGVEFLNLSKRTSLPDLSQFQFETK